MAEKKVRPDVASPTFERMTRQRQTIGNVFGSADRPLSTDEVLEAARRERATVSLATVYRSIRSLVDDGTLAVVDVPGGGTFYELAGKAHHHHFSCLRCKRMYELDGCIAPEGMSLPTGFRAVTHDLTVYGTCATCGRARRAANAIR